MRLWICIAFCLLATQAPAQDHPDTPCAFDGFSGDVNLAEVIGKATNGYFGCTEEHQCVSGKVLPGDLFVAYRTSGNWSCGYLTQKHGAGPFWVESQALRAIPADPHPPLAAWLGKWMNGDNRIQIRAGKTPGKLNLDGLAVWHGSGGSVHTGSLAGEAAPAGNRLHFTEGDSYPCVVDLTLVGRYLVADDNNQCGGANVRFWGLWKRD